MNMNLLKLIPALLLVSSSCSADKILVIIEEGVERANYQSLWSSLNGKLPLAFHRLTD
jgi:hypothetical protein